MVEHSPQNPRKRVKKKKPLSPAPRSRALSDESAIDSGEAKPNEGQASLATVVGPSDYMSFRRSNLDHLFAKVTQKTDVS